MGYVITNRGRGRLRGRASLGDPLIFPMMFGSSNSGNSAQPATSDIPAVSNGLMYAAPVSELNLSADTPLTADPNNAAIAAYQAAQYPLPDMNAGSTYAGGSLGSGGGGGTTTIPWYVWAAAAALGAILLVKR